MIVPIHSQALLAHISGILGYLRFGLAICFAFFLAGGIVALIQNGYGHIVAIAIGLVLTGISLAAIVPKRKLHSHLAPPAFAVWLMNISLPSHFSELAIGDLEEEYTRLSMTTGPIAARVWYWSQVARILRYANFKPGTYILIAQAMATIATFMQSFVTLMHFFLR